MNPLHLSGWGVKVKVRNLRTRSDIVITDGRQDGKEGNTQTFRPRRIPYDSIILDGHSGYLSLQALHWLSRNKVPVFILNFDGSVISSILPPMPVKADLRAAQFRAANDRKTKFDIAKAIVKAKIARSLQVLDWLAERYDIEKLARLTKGDALRLGKSAHVSDLRSVEGRVAKRYWDAVRSVIPECFDFQGRMTSSRQNNASDPMNAALNYAYGVLEGEVRRAINAVGLEPSAGFLHEFSDYQTKQSLVYDLEEPFRWLADVSVIQAFESGVLDLTDFYFTGDDYRYRFEPEAKHRFIGTLRARFNSGVHYNGRFLKWDTIVQEKTSELTRYLSGRSRRLDFVEPAPILKSMTNRPVREMILRISQSEARRRGIGKSTLHYLRKRTKNCSSFRVYQNVRRRLVTA